MSAFRLSKPKSVAVKRRTNRVSGLRKLFSSRPKSRKRASSSRRIVLGALGRKTKGLLTLLVLAGLPLLLVTIAYTSLQVVNRIRDSGETLGVNLDSINATTFKQVPKYPGAEYIFAGIEEQPEVQQLLASNRIAYRLPLQTSFEDAISFYKEQMEKLGWEHVKSVPRAAENELFGEYWVHQDSYIGIRIYTELESDIWYQIIAVEDANSGMSEHVKRERERELLIASTDGTDLLPDFPWEVKIPKEYLVYYFTNETYPEGRSVYFKRLTGNESVYLESIGPDGSEPYDVYLTRYLQEYNTREKEDDEQPDLWEIKSSAYVELMSKQVLQATISNGSISTDAYVIPNYRSKSIFLMTTFSDETHLLSYLLENMVEKRSTYQR